MSDREEFLTAKQLAEILQVSESTVRRLAAKRRIPSVRLTPHISWSYPGAEAALTGVFIENLRNYLEGADLRNVIDPVLSY